MKIGIDVGATHTKFGIVNGSDVSLIKTEPTIKNSKQHFLDNLKENIKKIENIYGTATKIGIAIAGLTKGNRIIKCANIPNLDGVTINFVHEIINDARAAALAEFHYGALKNTANSVLLTLGTGIGGAVFLDGTLMSGKDNIIGEIGHLLICKKGDNENSSQTFEETLFPSEINENDDNNLIEFEKIASGRALVALAKEKYPDENFTFGVRAFFGAVKGGDERAIEVLHEWTHFLAIGVCNLVLFYNPEIIAFGGGAAEDFSYFENSLKSEVKKLLIYKDAMPLLKKAHFGNLAGVFGATI